MSSNAGAPNSQRRRLLGLGVGAGLAVALPARPAPAGDKLTVMLDWFINPDHAPMIVAESIGAFRDAGLNVTFVAPADPSMPTKLVAGGHGDIAIAGQSTLYMAVNQGLPVMRVGTLMNSSLLSLAAIDTGAIKRIADLKGRRIGIANITPDLTQANIATMLATQGVSLRDVTLVNIGSQLVTSLLTHRIDAVTIVRTFESIELAQHGAKTIEFVYEDYGVPQSDIFIYVVNRDRVRDPKIARFLAAVRKGSQYLKAHPTESLALFLKAHPDLNNPLNKAAWQASLPYFAANPGALDKTRYETYADYLVKIHLLRSKPRLESYAVDLA